MKINRFDIVKILTTKNVHYLSAPPGTKTTPDGEWTVAAAVERDLLLTKGETVIRIPVSDVRKVLSYNLNLEHLGKLSQYGQETENTIGSHGSLESERTPKPDRE